MKRYSLYLACIALTALLAACRPQPYTEKDFFNQDTEAQVAELTKDGKLYHLDEFVDSFMTEIGNYKSDSILYRKRATNGNGVYLFSIDTLPADGPGIYIMGRITTDDYGGSFYKTLVIQEMVNGEQQNLLLSVDMGSANGIYQMGQQILVRCNGLAIGRYANEPQLCVPAYNNNINANKKDLKVGWAPGRIPSEMFRLRTTLIGKPDISPEALHYEELTLDELYSKYLDNYKKAASVKDPEQKLQLFQQARKWDGKLIRIKDVHFTGEFNDNGTIAKCTVYKPGKDSIGIPERDENTNVFAPTTENLNHPQGRFISNGTAATSLRFTVSTSEYAKFAHFYLPSKITRDDKGQKQFDYAACSGTIEGILSYYFDNAADENNEKQDNAYKWAITIRDLGDIKMQFEDGTPWEPVEFSKD